MEDVERLDVRGAVFLELNELVAKLGEGLESGGTVGHGGGWVLSEVGLGAGLPIVATTASDSIITTHVKPQ